MQFDVALHNSTFPGFTGNTSTNHVTGAVATTYVPDSPITYHIGETLLSIDHAFLQTVPSGKKKTLTPENVGPQNATMNLMLDAPTPETADLVTYLHEQGFTANVAKMGAVTIELNNPDTSPIAQFTTIIDLLDAGYRRSETSHIERVNGGRGRFLSRVEDLVRDLFPAGQLVTEDAHAEFSRELNKLRIRGGISAEGIKRLI